MEKVQSETWVGAMTPEQILELAHEAGFPRDTIFYRSDQFITFANAIAQRTRDALKAQAGEPDFYVRRRPSPGYEVVSSSDPMAQPAYLHPTTERPYNPLNDYAVISMNPTEPVKAQAGEPPRVDPNWVNIKMDVSNPTTERRVIPEELITRIKQTANRWANRSYDCGNRDGMGYQSSTPAKLMDQSRDDFNELIEELRNALNAAPAKGEV